MLHTKRPTVPAVEGKSQANPKNYHHHIRLAMSQGYMVDVESGLVTGKSGKVLSAKIGGNQKYASIPLVVYEGGVRTFRAVHVHKVIAFVKYGDAAFASGVHVRHRDGNRANNKGDNLLLGSPSDNNMDKNPEIRSRAARIARHSQGSRPRNARFDGDTAETIRATLEENKIASGRVKRGVVRRLAEEYQVDPSTISLIGKGKSYAPKN